MNQTGLAFTHQRVRRVRLLLRKRSLRSSEQVVVVEGAELVAAALAAGARVESVYVAPEGRRIPAVSAVAEAAYAAGARVFDLADGVIERIADTVTPQPVMAVVQFVPATLGEVEDTSMIVVCAGVRDPGNAGTVIRTADASGADAVICCDGTVDPTNPKTVRASAGSLFNLPVIAGGDPASLVGSLGSSGLTTVGTVVRDGLDYSAFDWTTPVAVFFGNESTGLDAELSSLLDVTVSIPMAGSAESLNVGVSAAVVCFEALRQRRLRQQAPPGGGRSGGGPSVPDGSRPTMPDVERAPAVDRTAPTTEPEGDTR